MKENRSVNRVLDVLELISQHKEGLTLGQIYRMLDIPKATAYDFLQTLYKADAVYYKDPRLKNYVIGSKMFAIGSVYTKNSNLIEAASFELNTFADEYGKTAFISKKTDEKIVYIYKYQSPNSLIITPEEIGTTLPIDDDSPIGTCFRIFSLDSDNTLDEKEKEFFQNGYVLSDKKQGRISVIAIPVKNFENRVTGVISVSDLFEKPESEEVIKNFLKLGQKVSKKLGYLGE
ncbi:Transcriptional regulator, IclR family [Alteracholeplasma palmae J233]|uniref:Transcriptional regulator, IclR family n=1 Tax=Alteracholeplasma palmae (strain ATCC 49389 / J233) TaxID=1318466 RepID=U4KKP5_ALTPJ|nr:helix-turn-helix domain-containing protein [Alteracholeplasma palmae]CCV64203.1 Transcriptional regulator, IclR family [Alteracholeplasma palmae J233]